MMNSYPTRQLADILNRSQEPVEISPEEMYKQVTVRLFHKGVVLRGLQQGGAITSRQWRVRARQVLLSRIDARNGAIGLVPSELDGAIVTNDFWAFDVNLERAEPKYLDLYFRTRHFVEDCQRASEGTTNRVRVQPVRFLQIEVPLPPISEQRRIISRIEELSAKIDEVFSLKDGIQEDARRLLLVAFHKLVAGAKHRVMSDVAPLIRRKVEIQTDDGYPELGIRSFGKGTFHKPALTGLEVGSKTLFSIESGDLIFNNVFAWEGAVAVAKPHDKNRFGSHRFITCVPKSGIVTPEFLCFYFLTEEGIEKLGLASPGGAGRNRTLGIEALGKIEVPVPDYNKQLWFDALQAKVDALNKNQEESERELNALMPSILSRAFATEL